MKQNLTKEIREYMASLARMANAKRGPEFYSRMAKKSWEKRRSKGVDKS